MRTTLFYLSYIYEVLVEINEQYNLLWRKWLKLNAQYDHYIARRRHEMSECPMERQRQLELARSSQAFLKSLA